MLTPFAPIETAKADAYKIKPSLFGPLIFNSAPYGKGGNKAGMPSRPTLFKRNRLQDAREYFGGDVSSSSD